MVTGRRAIVYVENPTAEKPTFDGREIVLGPRAGDYYLVRNGLKEGHLVVTNGNFKLDSALQIEAKPSMMSMFSESGPVAMNMEGSHGQKVPAAKASTKTNVSTSPEGSHHEGSHSK